MILYHGSTVIVDKPEILPSQRLLDFGEGFYTTSNEEQARRWALRVGVRRNSKEQYISLYEFNLEQAEKALKIIRFETADEKWLDFVCACRSGRKIEEAYDIVIGPVADDNVYATVQLYELGVLSKDEAMKRLKVEQLYNQVLFHTNEAIKYCVYKEYYSVGGDENGRK